MIRTNPEQEQAALEQNVPFVCMLCTKGENWTWYVDAAFRFSSEADAWYDKQTGHARVYKVSRGKATIYNAK